MTWHLNVNLKKTKAIIFQNNKRNLKCQFRIGDYYINISKSYKYLGTLISNTGNFKINKINLRKNGLRASFMLMRNIGIYTKVSTALNIFEKVVEPILTYNCEITCGNYMGLQQVFR